MPTGHCRIGALALGHRRPAKTSYTPLDRGAQFRQRRLPTSPSPNTA